MFLKRKKRKIKNIGEIKMSKYLNTTALVTGIIAAAIFMFAYNKVGSIRKVLGGA